MTCREILFLVSVFPSLAFASETSVIIDCKADFTMTSPDGKDDVEWLNHVVISKITTETAELYSARVESSGKEPYEKFDVQAEELAVRENLDLAADPYGELHSSYNAAELTLSHLNALQTGGDIKDAYKFDVRFKLSEVRSMRIFDLWGTQDKFGGVVLAEAFDKDGKLLGRVYRALMANGCN